MKHLIFILLFIPVILKAQEQRSVNLSVMLERGPTILANDWKYQVGDHPEWANQNFDDSSWPTCSDANLYNKEIQKRVKQATIIWFRKRIRIDSTITQKLVINLFQSGASEIYLDGELIHSLGKVSSNPDSLVRYNPATVPLSFPMKIGKEQVLAVRFADTKKKLTLFKENAGLLTIRIQKESSANDPLFVARDSLYDSNGILDLGNRNGWRFHPGDNVTWANPDFDDRDWIFYKPSSLLEPIPYSLWQGYGWFRYRFAADSSAYAITTNLYFYTLGAAEVYLDGKLVQRYGTFSTIAQGEKRYMPLYKSFSSIVLSHGDSHMLAVRYSYHKGQTYKKLFGKYAGTFGFGIGLATDNWNQKIIIQARKVSRDAYIAGSMLFLIVLLHGFLFMLFPAERSNLYIAIVATLLFLHNLVVYCPVFFELDILQILLFTELPYVPLFMAALSMFPFTINSMFHQKPRHVHKLLIWLFPVFALANFIFSGFSPNISVASVYISGILVFSSMELIQAWKNNQKGVWFVAGGFLVLVVSAVAIIFYAKYTKNYNNVIGVTLGYMIYVSFPLGLTAYMASRFRDLYTHLEQKVNERTRELNQSLEELRSTQTQLIHSEKMASLGVLTAGIAHEIQNPLNFVNNFSEVNTELLEEMKTELKAGNHNEAIALANGISENEKKINMHGKRADSIVKGMLQHSRTSSGVKELTEINSLADEFLRLSYHGLRAKDKSFNATLKSDFDSSIGKIRIVSDEIGRVILNLFNNAFYAVSEKRKLTPEGYDPTVSIITKKVGNQVEIKVQDNGNGIPQNAFDKIFQPFFTTKPTGQGTGLGLSIAYDIVKAHGGELKVKTEEGEGTEFTICLPIA